MPPSECALEVIEPIDSAVAVVDAAAADGEVVVAEIGAVVVEPLTAVVSSGPFGLTSHMTNGEAAKAKQAAINQRLPRALGSVGGGSSADGPHVNDPPNLVSISDYRTVRVDGR